MTMGLLGQAAIAQFRKRLAPPTTNWHAKHMATAYFGGLEGTRGLLTGIEFWLPGPQRPRR